MTTASTLPHRRILRRPHRTEQRSRRERAGYRPPIAPSTNLRLAAAGAAGAAAALAWWALWHEPRSTALRREALALPHWPRALDGLAVAVIADLHTGAPHVDLARVERIVERINDERPDLVVLLGDYADPAGALGEHVEPEQVAARLAQLRAPLGRFAVLGNHDWDHYGRRMVSALRDQGIAVLENDAARVAGAAAPFWVAGMADANTRDARIERALARVPEGEPVLLLSHDPDVFPAVPDRVSLTLSGHTHGSQVDLPFVRDRLTPSQYGARYTDGHRVEDGRHLYVSNGVGTSRLPIRFRARPEVALLRLEAE